MQHMNKEWLAKLAKEEGGEPISAGDLVSVPAVMMQALEQHLEQLRAENVALRKSIAADENAIIVTLSKALGLDEGIDLESIRQEVGAEDVDSALVCLAGDHTAVTFAMECAGSISTLRSQLAAMTRYAEALEWFAEVLSLRAIVDDGRNFGLCFVSHPNFRDRGYSELCRIEGAAFKHAEAVREEVER